MEKSSYYDAQGVSRAVAEGHHREIVGGMWDEIGALQLAFLIAHGLEPGHVLLDVGCGALRGGVRFAGYLDPGNYYGFDLNEPLLSAGYEKEVVGAGLVAKLPRQNLRQIDDFDARGFGSQFDYAIALSVFTHLPLNTIRVCLEQLPDVVKPGGRFFATIFEAAADEPTWKPLTHQPGGIVTHADRDPYHYRVDDLIYAAVGLPWYVDYIGDFAHPRAQKMVRFTRC